MRRAALVFAALAVMAPPAAAAQSTITCAASVTSNISTTPMLRDLKPSVLPVLGYRATPGRSEFKHLARLHGVSVGLYVYRVDENKAHMRLFEYDDGDAQGLLADTPLRDDLTELTFRAPGSEEMVTAYCYW